MRAATFKLPVSLITSAKTSKSKRRGGQQATLLSEDFPRAKESFAASEEKKNDVAGRKKKQREQQRRAREEMQGLAFSPLARRVLSSFSPRPVKTAQTGTVGGERG